jgi:hypothetical protein
MQAEAAEQVEPLDLAGLWALAHVARAARDGARVARRYDNRVHAGTARALVSRPAGGALGRNDDVRSAYLWVTLDNGHEAWWSVVELTAEQYGIPRFVVDLERVTRGKEVALP